MRILFVSAYFPPEVGAPANRVHELARRWARQGHRVSVLTGFPNHPTGVVPADYRAGYARLVMRETPDGIGVTRCWLYTSPNRKPWERILNYGSFGLSAALVGPWLERPDIVVATSPHLLVGVAGWWLSRLFRAPFCLELRDLWPESLVASGVASPRSGLIRSLRRLAGFLYRRADLIVTVTEPMAQALRTGWNVPDSRLAVIEHGVDGNRFRPMETVDEQPVVSYIGTVGLAHGLTTLLEAAERLQTKEPSLLFLIVGEGADKERLLALASERSLENVRFLPQQPRQEIPALINRSAVCAALLKPDETETFQGVLPTKVLEYLACGKPVVLAARGHARRILEEAQGGLAVEPGDAEGLASAILTLVRDPDLRRRCGDLGRRYVVERFDLDRQADLYLDLLNRTVNQCLVRTS